jgi:hypothetical protein
LPVGTTRPSAMVKVRLQRRARSGSWVTRIKVVPVYCILIPVLGGFIGSTFNCLRALQRSGRP